MDEDSLSSPVAASPKGLFHPARQRSTRNYRVKNRGNFSDDNDEEQPTVGQSHIVQDPLPHKEEAQHPLIQSQNAHSLGELYPSLSRLSFAGEISETNEVHSTQQQQPISMETDETTSCTTSTAATGAFTDDMPLIAEFESPPPALQRVWGTSSRLSSSSSKPDEVFFEVRDTDGKGLGLYYVSPNNEPLKPGRLVFRELPLTSVVNDASLPFVCSSCFRDTRAETEQESSGNGLHDGPGAKPMRSSKLVRCAGCKVVWYCNKTCQIKDWKLHHQLECQGIQQSMKNSFFQEIWTKKPSTAGATASSSASLSNGPDTGATATATSATKTKLSTRMDTTATRALCRLIRRRLRVLTSERYKRENGGRADQREKQVRELYSSTFYQQELTWQDDHGFEWLDRFIRTPAGDADLQGGELPSASSGGGNGTKKNQGVENQKRLTRILTLMASCIVAGKENRHEFFNCLSRRDLAASLLAPDQPLTKDGDELSSSPSSGAAQLARKLAGYGFTITNQETTKSIGLGLYVEQMAFMNHSCVPNCIYTFQGSRVECRVIRQVMPGEELTISYVDQIGTTRERQQQLKERYYFTCNCPLCLFYPANPMISSDASALAKVAPDYVATIKDSQSNSSTRFLEAKQGFLCGAVGHQDNQRQGNSTNGLTKPSREQDIAIQEESDFSPIITTDAHFDIYNEINVACSACQTSGHGTSESTASAAELDLELKQENEQRFEQRLAQFNREMKLLQQGQFSETMGDSRSFELWKAKNETDIRERKQAGIETRLGILPATARRAYDDCLQILREDVLTPDAQDDDEGGATHMVAIRRSFAHHLVRRFHQVAFDEAVASKRWVFALQQSLALEKIIRASYVGGLHPLRAIQALYTCKIANLLANLLLEESTIEIPDGDIIEFVDYREKEDAQDVAFMERELAKRQREKSKTAEDRHKQQWLEANTRRMANLDKVEEVELQADKDERVITVPLDRAAMAEAMATAPVVSSSASSSTSPRKAMTKRQIRDKTFQETLKMLKIVEPMVEEASLQRLFKICWGADGRIPRIYRDMAESFKQALYYAGLPMVMA